MRLPRVRFTVKRMMVFVALTGVACLGVRECSERWRRRGHPNPDFGSQLSVRAGRSVPQTLVAGQPIAVMITDDFK
jgi:hypothetical protein